MRINSDAQIKLAREALDHFGSWSRLIDATTLRDDGVYVVNWGVAPQPPSPPEVVMETRQTAEPA